jgi:serine/threonine protein kinase
VSASKPAVPEPSEIDGRYAIEKKLGAGAFGTVYKARDKELGRLVAIKTIRLEGLAASTSSLDDLLARFKREAQVAANLRHPNVVALWDWKNTAGFAYISMEFVDGVGLDRVIAQSGKMSVERAAAIGAQVADALGYAHKHGVVHRDIKPANIMIEPGDHVKVTDFGIAKMTDQGAEHLTVTGSLLGTPSYMSPEQARGGQIDGRSDLFSLGCVLYEMVAGQKAFRGDSITALLFKIITEEPPPLHELDPTVSDELLRIIGKALSKAPETRYQTGRELADDLMALTRPGFVPTLRSTDVPTLPPDTPPGQVPTIASPPTVRPDPTIGSVATAARPAAGPSAPGVPPPLPATILTPSTAGQASRPTPARAAPAARASQPLVGQPARRKGGGAGLVVGLGLAGFLALGVIAAGGWYLFGRRSAPAEPSPAPEAAQSAETPAPPPEPAADGSSPTTAEAAPTPAAVVSTPDAPSSNPRRTTARVDTTDAGRPATPPPPARQGSTTASGDGGAPAGGDYAFLDELPSETPDGREAGEALAQKYRSGGATGYPTTRFRARPRVPPGITLPERPAVATLLYLHTVEEAFQRKNGRYGTLRELADAKLLALDVAFDAESFRRARYRFRLTVGSDGFRADALPLGAIGRAFMVDDSGFVRLPD